MAKPNYIELGDGERISILYEDRSVLAIDKPPGWMLVPFNWQKTDRNLQAAIASSIAAGDFWAHSRNLKYLKNIHRLDADTSGILLWAKSPGGLNTYSALFESRQVEKVYLAVVRGIPRQNEWTCRLKLAPDPDQSGRIKVDSHQGKEAETRFRLLQKRTEGERGPGASLIEAHPITGRTHQIRVHLAESGHPVAGDTLYGVPAQTAHVSKRDTANLALGLRAVVLSYTDPFTRQRVRIHAPTETFLRRFHFAIPLMPG